MGCGGGGWVGRGSWILARLATFIDSRQQSRPSFPRLRSAAKKGNATSHRFVAKRTLASAKPFSENILGGFNCKNSKNFPAGTRTRFNGVRQQRSGPNESIVRAEFCLVSVSSIRPTVVWSRLVLTSTIGHHRF